MTSLGLNKTMTRASTRFRQKLFHTPLASCRNGVSVAVLGLALSVSTGAFAQPIQVNVPAQSLDKALTELGKQTGLQVLFGPEMVADKKSTAVKGTLEPEAALEALLKGAGLTFRVENNTVILGPENGTSSALELGATTIQGQGMGEMTENSGSYTTGLTSIGSKTPTSLRQTPQSVSVVTSQVIDEKRMTDLAEAMKVTPGITVTNNNFRLSDFSSRGFKIENIQIDGAAPMALGTTSGSFYSNKNYDLVEFDHVEVLRGASGLFGGTGDPGGMINLVRKRPLDAYQLKVDMSAGSWDNYRTQMDVTGPLGFDGKLRGRMVAAYTDRQYMVDDRGTEKPIFYGILEADILPDTRLTLGGRSERIHETGSGIGLPRDVNGKDLGLSRSTSLTQKWSYLDGRSQEIFAKVDHELNDDWKLNVSYTQTLDSGFSKAAFSFGAVDPVTLTGPKTGGTNNQYRSDQKLLDVNLAGKFVYAGLEHELLVGMDHQKITSQWEGTASSNGAGNPVNVFDPDATPWPQPGTDKNFIRNYSPNSQTQYGLYSTLRLQLADPLHLIIGARAQRYKFDQLYQAIENGAWKVQSDVSTREATKLVPYGGIVYDLTDEWSTYASYSEIFKPQQSTMQGPLPGSSMEPITGKTYETGVKGELWGGAVNTSFALYYTSRNNEAVLDPRYEESSVLFGGNCCYLPQGKVVSKGVDMEFTGEVLPDWNVLAGYTYNHNRNRTAAKVFSSITPKHQIKLWSTYRLPGIFNDVKVGGGVNLQSATYVSGTTFVNDVEQNYKYVQAGYAVWDSMAEYRVNENWSVIYNANNLFDKKYYSKLGSSASGNWYGDERNHMLTLRGTFW
jgi:outer membrane receptor for ferric coprogen and ferric-rhodotorulic acid